MADIHFEDVLKLAEQLSESEQNELIYHLQLKQTTVKFQAQAPTIQFAERLAKSSDLGLQLTREDLLREVEILRQTPARPEDSLLGKYTHPDLPEMSEEEFHAQIHAIATEWEQELDEFTGNES